MCSPNRIGFAVRREEQRRLMTLGGSMIPRGTVAGPWS